MSPLVAGTVLAGRYRVVSLLGRGGMGEVYKADDLTLHLPIALKLLPDHVALDPGVLARFHNEVRLARRVSHPSVCRVHDVGETGGRQFLTMEFIDGEDLASLLRRVGRLPPERGLQVARQMCAGLAAAHAAGVVHRDLKPSNVMIDGTGRARVTDFGVATVVGHAAVDAAGTVGYMSPEQRAGRPATRRSDIYALGLVLHELFTGRRADPPDRDADPVGETAGALEPEARLDEAVRTTIDWCLRPDPLERPGSAAEVAASLAGGDPLAAALAAGETPSPEMVAATSRAGALSRRSAVAWLAAFLGLVAGSLAVGSRLSVYTYARLDDSKPVLAARARDAAVALGYTDQPADRLCHQDVDRNQLRFLRERGGADWVDVLDGAYPSPVQVWCREHPRLLEPRTLLGEVTPVDPPLVERGARLVRVDAHGRLVAFRAVAGEAPARGLESSGPPWSEAFAAAGLNFDSFVSVAPTVPPPSYASVAASWQGVHSASGTPVRVHATSEGPWITYFEVVDASRSPASDPVLMTPSGWVWAGWGLVLGTALILARRNVGSGRGDHKGAGRVGLTVMLASGASYLLVADRLQGFQVVVLIGLSLVFAGAVWVLYLAVEPSVRRYWPRLLITWTRVVSGRHFDGLVWRDVLVGAVLLLAAAMLGEVLQSGVLVDGLPPLTRTNAPVPDDFKTGLGDLVYRWNIALVLALVMTLGAVLLRRLLGRTWATGIGTAAVIAISQVGMRSGDQSLLLLAAEGVWAVGVAFVLLRYGPVAVASGLFVTGLTEVASRTTHYTSWYGHLPAVAAAVLIAWGVHAYYRASAAGGGVAVATSARARPL